MTDIKEVIVLDKGKSPAESGGKQDKEMLILEAALKAYATHGIAHATTRQIADIAGIGKSTIFEYFQSKEELQNAALRHLMAGMTEGHQKLHQLAASDPLKALGFYIDSAIQIALHNPAALLLISQYSLSILLKADQFEMAKEQYSQKMHSVMQDTTDEFRFILERGIAMKAFHPAGDLPVEGLVYIIGALIREIQAQAFLKGKEELSRTCEVIKATIFRLLGIAEATK